MLRTLPGDGRLGHSSNVTRDGLTTVGIRADDRRWKGTKSMKMSDARTQSKGMSSAEKATIALTLREARIARAN
jgi:hypothetical protein